MDWKSLIKMPQDSILEKLKDLDSDTLLYKALPYFVLEIMEKYFRVKVEGEDNIPKGQSAIFAPNHSGYSGFDAIMLSHIVKGITKKVPKVLTHHLWFLTKTTSVPANRLGFIEATKSNAIKELKAGEQVILFPEGEYGNFKPSVKAYQLQRFHRGFVRIAIETGSPIVPVIVIGAEEAHINLRRLKLSKYLRGLVLPLPLNIIPLPSKWKIVFLKPIELSYPKSALKDSELMNEIAEDIREQMQQRINKELKKRNSIFL